MNTEKVYEDIIKTEDENVVVDDNTTIEDSDYEPVVSTEDQTLTPTDDIIPAVPNETIPLTVEEPVEAPVEVPGSEVVNPAVDVPVDSVDAPVDTPVSEPVMDAPLADIVPPSFDVPVDPVVPEEPVNVPEEPIVVPEEPIVVPGDACGDACCDEKPCDNACCNSSSVTIGQYFGTLQESVTIVWRFHLKTRKYSVHIALNEFYEKAIDIVDDIIEQYQGICGIVEEPFVNCVVGDGKSEGEYITELKAFVENNRCVASCGHSEIDSTIDEFLGLIDSTNYKLVNLTENAVKSFDEFCYEDYPAIKESCKYDRYGERSCDDPDDPDYDPEFENGECGGESCGEEEE